MNGGVPGELKGEPDEGTLARYWFELYQDLRDKHYRPLGPTTPAPARKGEELTVDEWSDLMWACQHMHDHAAKAHRISGEERDDAKAEKWADLAGKCEQRANALLRAAPAPAREGEAREAVVAVYEETGEVVSITFPEWWGPKQPDPDEFARRYPNTVGRRARLVIEHTARLCGEEGGHDHD
jgi:hypothetical protein